MAAITYTDGLTVIPAAWLNDVNTVTYTLFGNGTTYTGALTLGSSGNIAVNTNKFTVAASTGNTLVAGTLAVTAAATLSSTLASGALTVTGTMAGSDTLTLTKSTNGTFPTIVANTNAGSNAAAALRLTSDAGSCDIAYFSTASAFPGILTFNVPSGKSYVFQVNASTTLNILSTGISVTGTLAVDGTSSLGRINTTSRIGAGIASSDTVWIEAKAATTADASIRMGHGTAPTSPVNGDMWTTTGGFFIRINGVTKSVNLT